MELRKLIGYFCFFAFILFIGKSDVYGFSCNSECENISVKLSSSENPKELACLYEMNDGSGTKYYNYIYYDRFETDYKNYGFKGNAVDVFKGGTTLLNSFLDDKNTKYISFTDVLDANYNFIYESAYLSLQENICPSNSYVLEDVYTQSQFLCFDNDGECLSQLDINYLYDSTKSSVTFNNLENIIFRGTDRYTKYVNKEDYCVYSIYGGTDSSNIVYKNTLYDYGIFYYNASDNIKISLGLDISKYIYDKDYYHLKFNTFGSCPKEIYYAYEGKNYYFSDQYIVDDKIKDKNRKTYVLYNKNDIPSVPDLNKVSCKIFDDNLREIINGVMDIIRIAIPLLLILLIGVDFGKAIFASDDKAISKAKKNAITRIIIAIVIYFVPTLINLVFNIANDVWADAHYEICVLGENDNN